ncbi:zf-TFIIB domain-containing protein [Dactylosporangium sp. NPDC005555]|uniref:TFIIB-type zinc ribbon-containing protein n=1 Tax=Dactylosporangium sp. NPDC005555 TaxID=3154889 RepID=UPI0033A015BE
MQMTCPKCRGTMQQYERSGVTIEQCLECRGTFLDRGELERLIDIEGGAMRGQQYPPGYPPPGYGQPGYGGYGQPGYPPPGYGQPPYGAPYYDGPNFPPPGPNDPHYRG